MCALSLLFFFPLVRAVSGANYRLDLGTFSTSFAGARMLVMIMSLNCWDWSIVTVDALIRAVFVANGKKCLIGRYIKMKLLLF